MAKLREKKTEQKLLPLNVPHKHNKRKELSDSGLTNQRQTLWQWAFLLASIGCFLFLLHLYVSQFVEIDRLEIKRDSVFATLKREQAIMAKVSEEVRFLRTLEGVERLARERLKYIKRDEVVIKPVKTGLSQTTGE